MAITVTPQLSAKVKVLVSSVVQDMDLPRWLRDETAQGQLEGAAPSVLISKHELLVTKGVLSLSSDASGSAISAAGGTCLVGKSNGTEGGGLLSLLREEPCKGK